MLSYSYEANLQPKLAFLQAELSLSTDELRDKVILKPAVLGYSLAKRFRPRLAAIRAAGKDPFVLLTRITYTDACFDPSIAMDIAGMCTDAQVMASMHPNSFKAPEEEELAQIVPGNLVKVCVQPPGERFWTKVYKVKGKHIFAKVHHHLVLLDWPPGKNIRFHRNHVYDTIDDDKFDSLSAAAAAAAAAADAAGS